MKYLRAILLFPIFIIVYLIDLLYCFMTKISSSCPICQHKFMLPDYVCPKCGEKIVNLRPTPMAILHRKCECGTKLPTTFFSGRQKLKAMCKNCGYELDGGGAHSEVCIPIIGGINSGKTCFINQAIMKIDRFSANDLGLSFQYTENKIVELENNKRALNQGFCPLSTTEQNLKYYQFYLTPINSHTRTLVSLLDIGGEVFANSKKMSEQIAYNDAKSYIFVVDPYSIKKFIQNVPKEEIVSAKVSAKPIDEVLSMLITTIVELNNGVEHPLSNCSIVIAINKCDLFSTRKYLSDEVVKRKMKEEPSLKFDEAVDKICIEFFKLFEEENFLNMLSQNFGKVKFFYTSSLGHIPNGSPFDSSNVDNAVLWAINSASTIKIL